MRVATPSALLLLATLGCSEPPPALAISAQPLSPDTPALVDDAIALHQATRAGTLRLATDPNERFEVLVGPGVLDELSERGDWEALFTLGDEAFEAELPRYVGLGQGPPPLGADPYRPQPLHLGERGGLDASSCRACHFHGGPDGAGTATQAALLRSDGATLASATRRDAPHVMGLGWISLAARALEVELHRTRRLALQDAQDLQRPVSLVLSAQGLDFGRITAHPDGRLDTSEVYGISADLMIRPFGHKGRHASLPALADEALQIHLGLQSSARILRYAGQAEVLGEGPALDPDGDGVEQETTGAHAVLLGAYLSLLPVPRVAVPEDPELALAWARGRAVLDEVGCTGCHKPALRVRVTDLVLGIDDVQPVQITLPLAEAGLDPKPLQLDFGHEPDGTVPVGAPIYAYTDLRRHDLGPELAEPQPEILPDGSAVPGSVWLTRSLWGLADSPPYLHDGRARTVAEAIDAHGGVAEAVRDAWRALPETDRRALEVFLLSLTRDPTLLAE